MSKVSDLKKEMIKVYGNYCWMNDLWIPKKKNFITFHHIVEVRNGGNTIWENGALISNKCHEYLNYLDHYENWKYFELNGLFKELNRTYKPPTEEYYNEVKLILKK